MAFDSNVETGSAEFQVEVIAFRFLYGSDNAVRCVRPHKCRNISLPALIILQVLVAMHGECQAFSESLILEKIFRKNEFVKSKSRHRLDDEKLPQDTTSHISAGVVNVAASLFSPDINIYCLFKVSFKI